MPPASLRPLVNKLLDDDLTGFLTVRRARGDSFNAIALALRETIDVTVTSETIRKWCIELEIADQPVAS